MILEPGTTLVERIGLDMRLLDPAGEQLLLCNAERNRALFNALLDPVGRDLVIVSFTQVTVDGVPYTVWRSPSELLHAAMPPEGSLPTVAQLMVRTERLITWMRQPAQHTAEECATELLRLMRIVVRILEGRTEEQ